MDEPHIVIVGTTASGKSDIAIELASNFSREVISLDSMQIYKGMEIGTGVVPIEDRKKVTHHMISVIEPTQKYSVSQFKKDVYSIIEDSKTPFIFAGGTGLYTHAVIDNYSFAPTDENLRQEIADRFSLDEKNPDPAKVEIAYSYLQEIDANAAKKIDPMNVRRIIRAIEAVSLTDSKFSEVGRGIQTFDEPYVNCEMFGLRFERDLLRNRITQRVNLMFDTGWIQECEELIEFWDQVSVTAKSAIGYQPIVDWIMRGRNENELEELKEHIINKTAQFSRRQRKWFERDPRIRWIECDDKSESQVIDTILNQFDAHKENQNLH